MERPDPKLRVVTACAVALLIPAAFWWGLERVQVQTDITSALPDDDELIGSAQRIIGRHPALDLVTIELSTPAEAEPDPDRLVEAARVFTNGLEASGLFDQVGLGRAASGLPKLFSSVVHHLPLQFDAEQLERQVALRLEPAEVRAALERNLAELAELGGVGQAEAFALDPLGLRELVLARLAARNPVAGARTYSHQVLSADSRHLLLVADPKRPGADTDQARQISALLEALSAKLATSLPPGPEVEAIWVGSFRSALDNEEIVRADTQRAVWMATLGVALLLLLCFPRPWLGLLALVPALAGVALALLAYSLFERSISALALGFGGALIAITVDHAIAYLQFLDRTERTSGRQAAREVWAVGLFAALTSGGAFLCLYLSGYRMLGQVGLFAALGVGFSFAFVHTVFPLLFPRLEPARRGSLLPIGRLLSRLTVRRGFVAAGAALALAIGLSAGGLPERRVDLAAMNTVRPGTLQAERSMAVTWGDLFQRTYVMLEADDLAKFQERADRLAGVLTAARRDGQLELAFSPSDLVPGPERAAANLRAWIAFFSPERIAALEAALSVASAEVGFAEDAFSAFVRSLSQPDGTAPLLSEELFDLLGLARAAGGGLVWVGFVQPGPGYRAEAFCARVSAAEAAAFDPPLFSERLSKLLGDSFARMLLLVALAVLGLLAILFFDVVLVATAALPLAFGLACTLGSLRLLGHPLDIPGLMLAVVVLGMGVDYSLYFVRGQQRYFDPAHPSLGPVRMAVFLAAGSTLVGLGTLALADHAVPRSAGLTTLLGIGFCLLGTFALLPPLLNRLFRPRPFEAVSAAPGSAAHRAAVLRRYRHLEPQVRLAARFKLALDPMFDRLAELVDPDGRVRNLLDLGCGSGLPAAWLLALRPDLRVQALEPDPERARVAARVLGERGAVVVAAAPDLESAPGPYDAVMLIDVVHHLSDPDLGRCLAAVRARLAPGGRLVLRADLPGQGRLAWERLIERARFALARKHPIFRSRQTLELALIAAGFGLVLCAPSRAGREETWLVCQVGPCGDRP